ncbi:melanocortin receptor 4-like protein [Labeo rohita]|uniref:Melanocortin receptor 4-like protein n=1 Tax=Labeo rohita TaxID=84645 RepID=A0A498MQ32_LABRO|nr:melanocortin receptor 4-like protein [Labeo rohita]RXN34823.1 melanocortin receptor 4-like protein [Labeo rohita]
MNVSQSSAGLGTVLPLTSFENVLLFLFNIILSTAIIFFNVSVFVSIVMNRSLRNENRFMYMLSTCLSDICTGVSYYYVGVMDVRDFYESPTRTFYIVPTFLGLSYMAILAAQADRYHAVVAPFKYSQRMTRNRTLLVIQAYWVYAFLIVAVQNLVTLGVAKRVTSFGTFVANIFTVIIMIGLNGLFSPKEHTTKYSLENPMLQEERSSAGLGTVLPLTSFENVLLFLFNIILATAIIFFNVSVFVSIVMNRSLRNENRFMYMLSTCLSDICTGVSYYYAGVMDVRDFYESPTRTFYIVPTFLGLSYMAILAAQADRYHAVVAPFKYSQRMTRNRTLLVILAYWVYAFLIVAVNNLVTLGVAKRVTSFGTFVANIFTIIIMIGLNVRLFFIAKFQLEREPPSAERDNKRASVYLIIIVAVCFLIAWLPIFLHIIVCNFAGSICYAFRNEGSDPLRILPRVNAVLTPLLYIRGCSALRSTLLSKVWRTECCKRKG